MLESLMPIAERLARQAMKAVETFLADEEIAWNAQARQYRVGRAGHGAVFEFTFSGQGLERYVGGGVILRAKRAGRYVKSLHADYADADGDLTGAGGLEAGGDGLTAAVYLPFAAFADPDGAYDFEFILVRGDASRGPTQTFDGFKLDAAQFDRRNALAAICDGALGAVRKDGGEVQSAHIRTAREALEKAWSLDTHGLKGIRRYLRRAKASDLESDWYSPGRIAVDITDELSDVDDRVLVLRILYAAAAAAGGIGRAGDGYLADIAGRLDVPPSAIDAIRDEFGMGVHYGVLGLEAGAGIDAIKAAYRRLAKECHPDMAAAQDAEARAAFAERFRAVTLAYETLARRRA